MQDVIIGLDVGTTGCKAIVFDPDGGMKGYAYAEYAVLTRGAGIAEQDAENVYALGLKVLKNAIAQSGDVNVLALSLSLQGDAIIPVDGGGNALYNCLLGMDYRAGEECLAVMNALGEARVFHKTGMPVHPINSFVKMLWFKNKKPDVYDIAWKFMTYADFFTYRLCGEPVIDLTMASRTMAMDIASREWSPEILEPFGFDVMKLSAIRPSGTPAGRMLPGVAAALGLKNRPQVIAGGHDQTCGALGAGVIREGMAVDSSGTAEVFSTVFEKPVLSEEMMRMCYPCYSHTVPGLYFTFALNHTSGILLRWFRDELCAGERAAIQNAGADFYEEFQKGMENKPAQMLVLPHFNGAGTPICDLSSKGAFVGMTLSTTKKDIFKALLDSLTYELLLNLNAFLQAGIEVHEIRAVGGGAKSPLWLQVKADITGREIVTLKTTEAGCLGAAMLAAVGTGIYKDAQQAVGSMVEVRDVYRPDEGRRGLYMEKFRAYEKLYASLKDIHAALSGTGDHNEN